MLERECRSRRAALHALALQRHRDAPQLKKSCCCALTPQRYQSNFRQVTKAKKNFCSFQQQSQIKCDPNKMHHNYAAAAAPTNFSRSLAASEKKKSAVWAWVFLEPTSFSSIYTLWLQITAMASSKHFNRTRRLQRTHFKFFVSAIRKALQHFQLQIWVFKDLISQDGHQTPLFYAQVQGRPWVDPERSLPPFKFQPLNKYQFQSAIV